MSADCRPLSAARDMMDWYDLSVCLLTMFALPVAAGVVAGLVMLALIKFFFRPE